MRPWRVAIAAAVGVLVACPAARAAVDPLDPAITYGTFVSNGAEMAFHREGVTVSSACDYDWWYGCSPTSVGMVMGHYDREGYPNLIPGGVAEIETHYGPPTGWAAFVTRVIGSQGYVTDFYSDSAPPGSPAGYGVSGDDLPEPWHEFDCLADFMGTSQDAYGNANGTTTFHYYTEGEPLHWYDLENHHPELVDKNGMYGIKEYVEYCGYDIVTLYSQYIMGHDGNTEGFTLEAYKTEIDAGRPVLIHVTDHSMVGVGYSDDVADLILVQDTWSSGPHGLTWGGSYSGLDHYGVTVLEIIPEPATLVLLGAGGLLILVGRRRR